MTKKTADIVACNSTEDEIIIPRSINYKSTEFIITKILKNGFDFAEIKSIKFPIDTEIHTIEKYAFNASTIENFTIPSSLINLNDGCFSGALDLKKIDISPNNPRYKIYDDKFIIGKSILESKNFDVLVFCIEKVQRVTIPSFIKQIGSSAFCHCNIVKDVEIPKNSELETIGSHAFSGTSIERFTIPQHVTKICKESFEGCMNLKSIDFQENSELRMIEKRAFSRSMIEKFTVPPHLTYISELAFCNCVNLKTIEIPMNSELRTIEKEAFAASKIENFTISSSLVDLKNGWFCGLIELKNIDVSPENPRYKKYEDKFIIGKSSLDSKNFDVLVVCLPDVQRITITSFIKHIGSFAFVQCNELEDVKIPENSELETIGEYAFNESKIEKFMIPHHLTKISQCAFCCFQNLKTIEISANSKLKIIEENTFDESAIENFIIPSSLIDLNDGCISGASNLNKIDISPNNPRYKIYDDKFIIGKSTLESKNFNVLVFCIKKVQFACLPSFIKKIASKAFQYSNIQRIKIPNNSELEIIDKYAFSFSKIEKFTIPPHLTKINECAFSCCKKLEVIDIPENSELQTIEQSAFFETPITSFLIPPHLTQIDKMSFFNCTDVKIIEIHENSEIKDIYSITSNLMFDIVMIPTKLKHIFQFDE